MPPVLITMSASNIVGNKKHFIEINREIESLLNLNDDVKKLLITEITKEIRMSLLKKIMKILLIITFVITQIYVIPFINWNVSAVGRILMIKMLKFYDWRYLYNVDCLIDGKDKVTLDLNQNTAANIEDDCTFCENLEQINHESNILFSDLKSNYLYRGHPVVIEEHQFYSQHSNLWDYIESLTNLTNLINSSPCNLMTNLMTGSQYKSINTLLELINKSSGGWFIHFRNCDFDAVKSSRVLDQHPYFLTSHLKPFSSSWIMMSQRYKVKKPKKLWLNQIVVVKQVIGRTDISIVPKTGCKDICKEYSLQLDAGYIIVFSAEYWDFLYYPSDQGDSVTFIREYELSI